ncbi:MAG: PKD domain-containing protein [Bacteroidota bacterium]
MGSSSILIQKFCNLGILSNSRIIFLLIFVFSFQLHKSLAQNQTAKVSPDGTWYYEYLPADYNGNSDDYPIMFFFHGLGERGNDESDLSAVAKNGPPLHVKNGHDFPFILISPQLKSDLGNWPPSYMDEVVEHVLNDGHRIDLDRIYITGLSLGGGGAWFYAQSFPEKIAAVAPVCGSRNNTSYACDIAAENIPIWAFHGDADGVVSVNRTISMIEAINECSPAINPAPIMTIYEGVGHNSWSRAYRTDNSLHTPNIYEWFMQQSRASVSVDAGEDITLNLPTNSANISGSASSTVAISSYLWKKVAGSSVSISNSVTSTLSVADLVEGIYQFRLTATDENGKSGSDQMELNVVDSNSPPSANAGANKQIQLPTNSITISGSGTDSDGNIISYLWAKSSGGGATLTNKDKANLELSDLLVGTYVFELTVEDDDNATDSDEMQLEVLDQENLSPVANAGSDITIQLPTNSTNLSGSGSDGDGNIVAYLWEKTSGPSVSLSNANNSTATANNLVAGLYVFRLTVTDDDGVTDSDLKEVTVLEANQNPEVSIVDAEQSITLPTNSANIEASASDSDGNIESYLWEIISEPSASSLQNSTTPTLTVTALNIAGEYIYSVTVTDNEGATNSAEAIVNVNDEEESNQRPIVDAGPDQFIVLPTNQVVLYGTASDPDGEIVSYVWTKATGGDVTFSGENSATLTAYDLVEGNYRFRLSVTDNEGAQKTNAVDVNVAPSGVNVAPIVNAGSNRSITLPTDSVMLNANASDEDGEIISYLWVQVSGNTEITLTAENTATLELSELIEGIYDFRVRVEDDEGSSASDEVRVTVTVLNTPPLADAGVDKSITLPEDSVGITGSGTDEDGTISSYLWAQISGPSTAVLLNEDQASMWAKELIAGQYHFTITVTDNDGDTDADNMVVNVSEYNNSSPVVNAGSNRNIDLPTNSLTINGSATDSDGTIASIEWTQLNGPSTASLSNINTLNLTVSELIEGQYVFQLTVIDNEGAQVSDQMRVTVISEDVNSFPIVDAGENVTIKLPTNSTTLNGSASDVDGEISSYRWSKLSGASVTLNNQNTANLTISDLKMAGSYTFRLSVTDNDGAVAIDDVFVFVLSESTNVSPDANAGNDLLVVLPLNSITISGVASDIDGEIVDYEWSQISGDSLILVNSDRPNLTVTELIIGEYIFKFKVKDSGDAEDSDEMVLTVTDEDVNQAPIADAGPDQSLVLPTNSIVLNGSGYDPEGKIASYSWNKVSGGNAVLTNSTNATLTLSGLELGVYSFRLKVTDEEGLYATNTTILNVLPENTNKTPLVSAGPDKNIKYPQNQVAVSGTASDSDGAITAIVWTKLTGGSVSQNDENTRDLKLSDLEIGEYTFEILVTDNNDATASDAMKLSVLPENTNNPPVVNVGDDIRINLPENSMNITVNANDADGDDLIYAWAKINGPKLTLNNVDQKTVNISDLIEGTYEIRIRVSDTKGATGEDIVKIDVLSEEIIEPPIVNAGSNISIQLPRDELLLIGEAESEKGTVTKLLWEQISGERLELSGINTSRLLLSDLKEGQFKFRFTATDNVGQISFDEVQLNVLPEEEDMIPAAPVLNLGEDIIVQLPDTSVTVKVFAESKNSLIAGYSWEQMFGPTALVIKPDTSNIVQVSNFTEGAYYVKINVWNVDGLESSATKRITVLKEAELARPRKIFSPNGDGIDDKWKIEGAEELVNCKIKVFDRIGRSVFESIGYANEWDGKLNSKPMRDGTYYYVIGCSDIGQKLTGTVVIIR